MTKAMQIGHARPARNLHLALVNGTDATRFMVQQIAETQDWILDRYSDRDQPFQCLRIKRPDLVVIVVVTHGPWIIQAIQSVNLMIPGTNVMILSERRDQEAILTTLAAGARSYLLCPLPVPRLTTAIRTAAKGSLALCVEAQEALLGHAQKVNSLGSRILSQTEKAIVPFLAQNLTEKEIASRLGIATSTIHEHIKRLYIKLDVHCRKDALRRLYFDRQGS